MKFLIILSLAAAAFAVPNRYGPVERSEVHIEAPRPVLPVRQARPVAISLAGPPAPISSSLSLEIPKTSVHISGSSIQAAAPVRSESSHGYGYGYEAPQVVRAPPKYEAPKYEAPTVVRIETPKYEAPKYETPKYEAPKYEAPKYEAPKYEAPRTTPPPTRIQIVHEAPKVAYEAPKVAYEAPKVAYEAPKVAYEAPKVAYEAPRVAPTYGGYETVKAAPAHGAELKESHRMIPIVKHVREDDTRGHFKLEVETAHGIVHAEQGSLKDLNLKEGPVSVRTGSYSYTGPDGKKYTVNWTADEKGFHAQGEHLPTPPPIPEAIKKSLALPRVPEHLQAGPLGEGELPHAVELHKPLSGGLLGGEKMSHYGGYGEEKIAVRQPAPVAYGY